MYILSVYFIYLLIIQNMITIKKVQGWRFILENNNITVNTMFNMWKIWLTKREIADVYWVEKSEIKKELNKIALNSNIDLDDNIQKVYNNTKWKNEKYYSLDILLLLGYNSKHFKETKFLINTNKIIKEYTNSRQYRTNNPNKLWIINKIVNYFQIAV